jgi:hypothetical protein
VGGERGKRELGRQDQLDRKLHMGRGIVLGCGEEKEKKRKKGRLGLKKRGREERKIEGWFWDFGSFELLKPHTSTKNHATNMNATLRELFYLIYKNNQ